MKKAQAIVEAVWNGIAIHLDGNGILEDAYTREWFFRWDHVYLEIDFEVGNIYFDIRASYDVEGPVDILYVVDGRARFYKLFKLDQFLEDLIEWLTVK